MKAPLSWLRDYVEITDSPSELAHRLTMAGTEVASVQSTASWDNVVVGHVKAVRPHPDADRLRLVTVDNGSIDVEVVCGAPNVAEGQKIAYAAVGANLIDGHTGEPAKLKRSKIRGVVSEGMVCSEKELGMGDSHEGILVLDQALKPGTPLREVLGDTILDLELTPNRPDCLSMVGVAREIAALTGKRLTMPQLDFEQAGPDISELAKVRIDDPDLCPRYMAAVVQGIRVGPSPAWLQDRLRAIGERPINNIVDVTNNVMFEIGQPLHAFDYDRITDHTVVIRRAAKREKLLTLDGRERTLDSEMLLIADPKRGIGLAGVMGAENSEISESTVTVLLESATFTGSNNRRTARALDVSSQATLRFEKGLRSGLAEVAVRRAARLLLEVAGGIAARGIIDEFPGEGLELDALELPAAAIERVLGVQLPAERIEATLGSLGFGTERTNEGWRVAIPYWRPDVTIVEDLCEELARTIGYDKIPTRPLEGVLPRWEPQPELELRRRIVDGLVSAGLQETISYSATTERGESRLRLDDQLRSPLKVSNPISADHAYMRRTLREAVLETVARNSRVWREPIAVFEAGRVFIDSGEGLPDEPVMVTGAVAGVRSATHWDARESAADFFDAKGAVEYMLGELGVVAAFEPVEDPTLIKGRTARITVPAAGGVVLGVVGEVRRSVLDAFDVEVPGVALFDLDMRAIASAVKAARATKYRPFSRQPDAIRDLALVLDRSVPAGKIVDIVQSNRLVKSATLFDVYEGKGVPDGKKSVAVRVIYQSERETLSSDQLEKVEKSVLRALASQLGAELRAQA